MGLKTVAQKSVETVFRVMKDAVKNGNYVVKDDDGWGNTSQDSIPVRVILDRFKQEDVESSSFYELIQHTDTKGLVPGVDLTLPVKTSNVIEIDNREFKIVAFETDPLEALFTLLLRDV